MTCEAQVSILVPVHDAIPYLPEMLASIDAQVFRDFEVVCVDDGSTDGSGDVLDRWAASREGVTVVHQPCRGVGVARNVALDRAGGRYVLFADADDVLEPTLLERAVGVAEELDAQVVLFGYREWRSGDGSMRPCFVGGEGFPSGPFSLRDPGLPLAIDLFSPSVWSKLFSRALLEGVGLRFCEGLSNGEDMALSYEALGAAERVASLREPLYRYRVDAAGSLNKAMNPSEVFAALREIGGFRDGLYLSCDALARHYVNLLLEMGRYQLDGAVDRTSFLAAWDEVRETLLPVAANRLGVVDGRYRSFLERIRAEDALGYLMGSFVDARGFLAEANARAGALAADLQRAEADARAVRSELDAIRASHAFRIGRALTWAPAHIRRALRGER